MIKKLYSKINNFFVINFNRKRKSVADQKAFLDSLKMPKDDYEFAFNKYKCQMYYHYPMILRIAYQVGAVFAFPVLYFFYLRNAKVCSSQVDNCLKDTAVVRKSEKMNTDDVIPKEFLKDKGKLLEVPFPSIKDGVLDATGRKIVSHAFVKYWYHPYFVLIVTIKIGEVGFLEKRYLPKYILSYVFERDLANPLESMYCELKGINHVCFMHGDSLYSVDRAYSRPTYYCVWDEHYVKMFQELKCSAKEFVIYTPEKWEISNILRPLDDYPYDFTYYFSAETSQMVEKVKTIFDQLREKGYRCKVRMHPRFSDEQLIKNLFTGYTVEDTDLTLQQSLLDTRNVVALNSTVLSQAYLGGKQVIIDDVTNVEKYNSLYERNYIMTRYQLKRFSELLNEILEDNIA